MMELILDVLGVLLLVGLVIVISLIIHFRGYDVSSKKVVLITSKKERTTLTLRKIARITSS